ncbi:O-antigen ligase family protein [Winogradskyella sp.]|uniref:O-antigen ligase family protein n=1 Tax=Winogradskyella sp. TaxID=1883156 RepID=UPI0025E32FAA|nr:O-antigen ligase family protein [Winogradskyella sp.]
MSQFVHKAYLGINILISIVLLEFWKTKYLKLLLQLLLLVTLVVFKAKAQIIVGILLGAYIAYNLLKKQKSILALAIIILGFVAVLNFNKVYGKIKNLTLSSRVEIAKCSYEISKESFLFGIGVGDVKNRLNECYLQKECNDCTNLNSHNYYMNILLSSGVLGLALFIFSYAKIILYSKGTNKELLMILLIILFSMLFENIYSRMWGCLSGGLFINLLLSQKLINKNESFISTKIQ